MTPKHALVPILAAGALAACAPAPPPAAAEDLTATITALEEARLAAFRADDKPAYARIAAEDLRMVHSNGAVATRAEEMAVMRPPTPENPLPTLHLEDTEVRSYGRGAVMTGSLVERDGDRVALRLRFVNL